MPGGARLHVSRPVLPSRGPDARLGGQPSAVSNERLEFLGDAILGAIVCELLFRKFPEYLEGELTRIKSVVVSRRTCAKISQTLGFDEFLVMGKGMGSQERDPLLGPGRRLREPDRRDLPRRRHGGGQAVHRPRTSRPRSTPTVDGQGGINYKSNLQQVAQRQFGETPTYLLLDEKGPDHSKCFKISAQIGRQRYAPAWGRNKKDAEQRRR